MSSLATSAKSPGHRSKLRSLLIAATVAVVSVYAPGSPARSLGIALAARACSGATYQYAGLQTDTITYGTDAYITTQSPTLCTGTQGSYVGLYTMLAGGGSADGWTQGGYQVSRSISSPSEFTQICETYQVSTNKCVLGFNEWDGADISGKNEYTEQFDPVSGYINVLINNVVEATTSWDPSSVWTQPFSSQWYAESTNGGNDVPGTASNPVYFSYTEYESCSTGCWGNNASGTPSSDNSRWSAAWVTTGQKFEVYTNTP